jgi:hypothetical protein
MSPSPSPQKSDVLIQRFWIVLGFIAMVLLVTTLGLTLLSRSFPEVAIAAPALVGLTPVFALAANIKRKRKRQVVTYAISLAATLPLGIFCSISSLYGIGLSGMSGMRW